MHNYVEEKKVKEYNKKIKSRYRRRDWNATGSTRFKKIFW